MTGTTNRGERAHDVLRGAFGSADSVDASGGRDGVYGSRMPGWGFDRSVLPLARTDAIAAVSEAVDRRYRDLIGVETPIYHCDSDGGVRPHDSSGTGAEASNGRDDT